MPPIRKRYRLQSGITVSYDKTTLYRIGSLRHSNATLYSMYQYKWSNEDIKVLSITTAHGDIVSKNYSQVVECARTTCNLWCNRGLTLIGKVQVINTLMVSIYIMLALPIISQNIVTRVYNTKQGGLGLVNLLQKDKALKATRPFILQEEEEYATMVYAILKLSSIKEHIWCCYLKPEDVCKLKIKK